MPGPGKSTSEPGWLLLIHQIPPKPNYFRVKIWRRLQRLGAVGIKNSVYALPSSEQAHEELQLGPARDRRRGWRRLAGRGAPRGRALRRATQGDVPGRARRGLSGDRRRGP